MIIVCPSSLQESRLPKDSVVEKPIAQWFYQFTRATITKWHGLKLGGLKHRNIFFHSPRGWKSKIKVRQGYMPSEAFRGGSFLASSSF